jgi:hypothetical protein
MRRRLLMNTLFGTGLLGLRSLATGIPISILANPRQALAGADAGVGPTRETAQYIILSTSAEGDPVNCNVPGTYLHPGIVHPQSPMMTPTPLTLRGDTFFAAQPWARLPQALLDRTCFFHHGTYSVVHSEEQRVLSLSGHTLDNEMFVSLLAGHLAPALGTVQSAPLVLGPRNTSEALVFQTQPQPILAPSALALLLGRPSGALGRLTELRDRDLNRLNALIRCEGTPGQAAFIDQYVRSQSQVRAVSESLLSVLQGIQDDSVASQVLAAVTLIRMNVAPVISLNIPFGGDNHSDGGLMSESMQTSSGVASIGALWSALAAHGLQDRVSFLMLNVFGRTMSVAQATGGRTHNAEHHAAVMFGAPFRGSVIGGVEPTTNDFGAMSIQSSTGRGVPGGGGDIGFNDTFTSMAVTFARGVGAQPSFIERNIFGGTVIDAALAAR